MKLHDVFQVSFDFFKSKPVIVEPVEAQLSSDAGLLPIREFDQRIGFSEQFADALHDLRRTASVEHPFEEMFRSRLFGILADYEDQNDHDVLRSDPVFKLIAGRSPDDGDLASQPTLSRFENAIDIRSFWRLRDVLIDRFIASFDAPPARLTFDVDCFDDPAHGQQQLIMFHGFYNQYQYLPRAITCAENDLTVMVCLLFGTANPALGIDDDLEYLSQRLRAVWPDVEIHLRADSGFATPITYNACERLDLFYTLGLRMNPVLKRASASLLNKALTTYESEGESQRLFESFWYRAGSWPHERFVVIKAEANAQGTNRRAVLTNRPGAMILPEACYDAYADRGESENRNKEFKCEFRAVRLTDHRYLANLFRLYLHIAAANLLVLLRREIAAPPRAPHPPLDAPEPLPVEALPGQRRRDYYNRRRQHDPLGEGHACTWRTRLIKVAAQVVVRARCIRVRLSGCWPYLDHFQQVSQAALQVPSQIRLSPD